MENTRRDWTTASTFIFLLLIFLTINFVMIRGFLLSVLMGGIIALLVRPLYRKLQSRRMSDTWAAALVTLGVTLLLIGPLILFGTVAVKQAIQVGKHFSENDQLSFENISQKVSEFGPLQGIVGSPEELEKQLRSSIKGGSNAATAAVLGAVGSLPDKGLQIALALLSCFFLLIDGRRFVLWLADKLPLDWDIRAKLFTSFKDTAVSVIWATLAAAAVQAAVMLFSFLVLGVPAAFLAAGATFVFAWIPVLGSTPVWLGGALWLYLQDSPGKAVIMIALGIFCSLIDNYVRPLVLKGRGDMHPLVSLVAIFGGIELFGLMGVFVGPILAAILISLLQIWPLVGRRFGLTYAVPGPVGGGPGPGPGSGPPLIKDAS